MSPRDRPDRWNLGCIDWRLKNNNRSCDVRGPCSCLTRPLNKIGLCSEYNGKPCTAETNDCGCYRLAQHLGISVDDLREMNEIDEVKYQELAQYLDTLPEPYRERLCYHLEQGLSNGKP